MTPRWFSFGDEYNKRTSIMSNVHIDDSEEFVTKLSHPFFNKQQQQQQQQQQQFFDILDRADPHATQPPKSALKRLSIFARNKSTDDKQLKPLERDTSRSTSRIIIDPADLEPERSVDRRFSRYVKRPSNSGRPSTAKDPFDQDSEKEFYRTLKKSTISAPFNFQHITHTQRQELPKLDLVDDRELKLEFWAASASQLPGANLRGIQAEHLPNHVRRPGCHTPYATSPPTTPKSRPRTASVARPAPSFEDAIPRLSRTRQCALSNASQVSARDRSRPGSASRAASLQSIISQPRSPPTMIHPALRGELESCTPQTSPQPTSAAESSRNLDVVPEEFENTSPQASPSQPKTRVPTGSPYPDNRIETELPPPTASSNHASFSSLDVRDATTQLCQRETSIPSLSSGDSWEDDVDFCYNIQAESTCDFEWTSPAITLPSPRDSLMPTPPQKPFAEESGKESPRTSLAKYQRGKSPTASDAPPAFVKSGHSWRSGDAEHKASRLSPGNPSLPQIPRLSSFFNDADADVTVNRGPNSIKADFSLDLALQESILSRRRKSDVTPAVLSVSAPTRGHLRAKSAGNVEHPPLPRAKGQRWSFMPPSHLRDLNVTPLDLLPPAKRVPRAVTFSGSPTPPPRIPLPPVPQMPASLTSIGRPATVTAERTPFMRRPQNTQDRSLLHSAGRFVQNGRGARPSLPSRLNQVHHAAGPYPRGLPCLSKSTSNLPSRKFESFPLPPSSSGDNLADPYPAWI